MARRGENWSGRNYNDILGARNVSEAQEFPRINPKDPNHHVLFKVENQYRGPPEPYRAHQQRYKWDSDHVKMPYDLNSRYVVSAGEDGSAQDIDRWRVIQAALSQPINNIDDLIEAIMSYNGKHRREWKFPSLKKFVHGMTNEERHSFFNRTVKGMAALALQIQDLFQAPVPLLKKGQNKAISMSQQQISSILANAFFCTFPSRNARKGQGGEYRTYPGINFTPLFESPEGYDNLLAKIHCIIHYFNRVLVNVPTGVVTFARRYVPRQKCPDWERSRTLVKDMPLHMDCETSIEDAHGLIQVDFANKYIGGGVIGHGTVQEEIRFATHPELIASKLFTESLDDTEAVLIIGAERYCSYSGYRHSFHYEGDYRDETPYDSSNRRKVTMLAIDAKPFSSRGHEDKRDNITRELNKAWVGFTFYAYDKRMNYPGVATGNWGSGAFGGSKSIKTLIQLMACAQARRPMAYYSFHDCELLADLDSIYNSIKYYNVTVGQLYKLVVEKSVNVSTRSVKSFVNNQGRQPTQGYKRQQHSGSSDGESEEDLNSQKEYNDDNYGSQSTTTGSRNTRSVHCDSGPEPCQEEIFNAILDKFINDSSDLFSQDEDQNSTDLQTDKPEIAQSKHDQRTEPKNENKMADGDKSSKHTSGLFDKMQKFDDVNGTLNLSIPSEKNKSMVLNDTVTRP